jgi:hypothetical protein
MKETAPAVDVLSFHDCSSTCAEIPANVAEAQAFAASVHKPAFSSEIARIGRANPYDMALEEFSTRRAGTSRRLTIVAGLTVVCGLSYCASL